MWRRETNYKWSQITDVLVERNQVKPTSWWDGECAGCDEKLENSSPVLLSGHTCTDDGK